ncbi:peptidylprolyl isomerase [Flavobacterium sp. NKUCC04_CG]|uniref:peptidylprolyl isomerase n=1 Tax=Flavobacterium sp. NKUCC04_CG TaxID=2842121 RepID=UPI001C5AED9C|nr:peptidylprolyl isomerase [Flavobacterium sp. NKUCC04_CG]MBW3520357.1 peptidylprolyl isomerase [Flavobacterium sp. NKUCC04_CG]
MNFKSLFIIAISTWGTLVSQAQSQDKVLFTLDYTPYFSEEFKRIYSKNLDLIKDNAQRDVDQYLDLYVLYKLKVDKAYELRLDENPEYKRELKSNRDQLAERYLTDEKITEELVLEAYQRSLKEINADHILFLTSTFAKPADTLKAYNKAMHVRNEIIAGANFNEMAKKYSEDPSAKENGGELGYFSVFKMVYPFESGAYNTAVGSVSMPIRSQFGYHLIKVNGIRENRGEVSVAHLMLLKSNDNKAVENKLVEAKINEIATELKNGADFDDMVRQYSQDVNTAKFGGILQRFGAGGMNSPEFEEAAFSLKNTGELSMPVQTSYGWHLIKLIQKHPVATFEESKVALENRVQRDSRSRVIDEQLLKKIRSRYNLVVDYKLKKQLASLVNSSFYNNQWVLPADYNKYEKPLCTIDNKKVISGLDFLKYLEKNQQAYKGVQPLKKAVDLAYDKYLDSELKSYYIANLEKEFPEFEYTVKEYREGLLLFDLMDKEIWAKSQADTVGYTAYYENNKSRYIEKARVDMVVYAFPDAKQAKKAWKKWKKKSEFRIDKSTNVSVSEGVFDWDSPVVASKGIVLQEGVYLNEKQPEEVIVVKAIIPEQVKALSEVRAQVVQEYQEFFEKEWINSLKTQKHIQVDQAVLEAVKQELRN